MPYEVVRSELKYKGRIIDVVEDEITLPDGRTALRETVVRGQAAAIVPVDKDGNITLVRQYRHGPKQMVLEIPAGMVNDGEDAAVCAVRELEEETGIITGRLTKLLDYYVSVGFCTETIVVYLAEELSEGQTNPDPDEFLDIEKRGLNELIQMIMSGEITDSKTICAVFAAREHLAGRDAL